MYTLQKILVYFIALVIANYSVDTPAPFQTGQRTGHVQYNSIESLYELITEEWLGMTDHVPETDCDDEDTDDETVKTGKYNTDWLATHTSSPTCIQTVQKSNKYPTLQPEYYSVYLGNFSPPPDPA